MAKQQKSFSLQRIQGFWGVSPNRRFLAISKSLKAEYCSQYYFTERIIASVEKLA
jgi:hypothetical protein